MGEHPNVSYKRFPKQGEFLHKMVNVCFNYQATLQVPGIVIRDDTESPGLLIIHLFDGRTVLSTECQYSLATNQ